MASSWGRAGARPRGFPGSEAGHPGSAAMHPRLPCPGARLPGPPVRKARHLRGHRALSCSSVSSPGAVAVGEKGRLAALPPPPRAGSRLRVRVSRAGRLAASALWLPRMAGHSARPHPFDEDLSGACYYPETVRCRSRDYGSQGPLKKLSAVSENGRVRTSENLQPSPPPRKCKEKASRNCWSQLFQNSGN